MHKRNLLSISMLGVVSMLAAAGCGDNNGDRSSADDVAEEGVDTNVDDNTEAATEGNDNADNTDDNPGDGDGDPDGTDTDTSNPTADEGEDGPKFDLGGIPDGHFNCSGGGGNNDPEFSFLWAANSSQGTISKIDTKTVTEVGRFIVRPDLAGSPSRTSVSLSGHVAVANRSGGVTKIYANPELCEESNGMPGIQTSNNNQYLPWDQEECRAWYTPFNYESQRPVAWGPGEFNEGTCQWEDEELWTSGNNGGGTIDILILDGDDGTVKEMIAVPANGGADALNQDFYGIYGAAVDGDGNFWGSQLGSGGKLITVNRQDLSYKIYQQPAGPHWYGMTVDTDGMVWVCSATAGRFDPLTESWTQAQAGGWTGCMADANENGLLWMADGSGVVGINRDTLQVEKTCAGPGSYGISIDFEGYVWAVANGNTATKIDPETCQTWSYNGLIGAYTYSDMTGYALSNAGTPSG